MKLWIKPVALIVASTCLFGCNGDDYDSDIFRLESENQSLSTEITQLKEQLNSTAFPLTITLLHMNDHHSHLEAELLDYSVQGLGLAARNSDNAVPESVSIHYGGFPMLVSLFDDLAAQSINPVKIHAGDAMTGTLYNTLFKGEADAAMMNQVCFDVFAPGNHEFDAGDAGLARFLDELNSSACKTATLAANVNPHSGSAIADGYLDDYKVMDFDGEKVAFVGIDIAGKTKNSSFPDEGTTFADETETAQSVINTLKADGINKIVLVTHYQYTNDLKLAQALSGVDVIVGGDSHSLLGDESFAALGLTTVGDYPSQVNNLDGEPVCVVQAWEYGHMLGRLEVRFDEQGIIESCAGTPVIPMEPRFTYKFSDDEERELNTDDAYLVRKALSAHDEVAFVAADVTTTQLLEHYKSQTDVLMQTSIGTVADDLCLVRWPGDSRSTLCGREATYAQGSDISNIVAKAFLKVTPDADIAIQNGGGVRVDVAAGNYTIGDAYTLLPFANTLVILEMTGQQIKDVLEDALAFTLDDDGSTGAYPYASGLRYNVDASAEKGRRVTAIEINPQVSGDWSAIDSSAVYKVVTNNFIASGRDGYTTFATPFDAGNFVDTYTEYAQGFVTYMHMLSDANSTLKKLPASEYSTQQYIGRDGCNHSTSSDCVDY